MSTKLVYLENMHDLEADAYIERVDKQNGRDVVYLDQTILYPQGGGQPYDKGVIQGGHTKFIVEEVRFVDGDVLHFGHFEGYPFMQGEDVHIIVDGDRRKLNARLHSGGHLVDMAVSKIKSDWIPGKGKPHQARNSGLFAQFFLSKTAKNGVTPMSPEKF